MTPVKGVSDPPRGHDPLVENHCSTGIQCPTDSVFVLLSSVIQRWPLELQLQGCGLVCVFVCVHVCVCVCSHMQVHVSVDMCTCRGQNLELSDSARLAGQRIMRDPPVLSPWCWNFYGTVVCAPQDQLFTWMLGIWTHVITPPWEALCPLSCLPQPWRSFLEEGVSLS